MSPLTVAPKRRRRRDDKADTPADPSFLSVVHISARGRRLAETGAFSTVPVPPRPHGSRNAANIRNPPGGGAAPGPSRPAPIHMSHEPTTLDWRHRRRLTVLPLGTPDGSAPGHRLQRQTDGAREREREREARAQRGASAVVEVETVRRGGYMLPGSGRTNTKEKNLIGETATCERAPLRRRPKARDAAVGRCRPCFFFLFVTLHVLRDENHLTAITVFSFSLLWSLGRIRILMCCQHVC
jgi:hypothetical protein